MADLKADYLEQEMVGVMADCLDDVMVVSSVVRMAHNLVYCEAEMTVGYSDIVLVVGMVVCLAETSALKVAY